MISTRYGCSSAGEETVRPARPGPANFLLGKKNQNTEFRIQYTVLYPEPRYPVQHTEGNAKSSEKKTSLLRNSSRLVSRVSNDFRFRGNRQRRNQSRCGSSLSKSLQANTIYSAEKRYSILKFYLRFFLRFDCIKLSSNSIIS